MNASTYLSKIFINYIEPTKLFIKINIIDVPALMDVDVLSEYLCSQTKWSTYNMSIDMLYYEFIHWLRYTYGTASYRKSIFITKLSTKRNISIAKNIAYNIQVVNMIDVDQLRL